MSVKCAPLPHWDAQTGQTAGLREWVALAGSMLGAFMAVLDIQITNASLKDILGSLGATLDEGSWVSTSYLVAEIVAIPLTGWFCEILSLRRCLLGNAALFLLFSIACGWAWNLESLIVFRVLQGFTGGALIPTAFNLVLKLLPPSGRGAGFALFGITATFAPAIGPTIGGWLTENYGWPAIFYINLVPGALLLAAVAWGLKPEPSRLSEFAQGDGWGILTMAVGLGALIIFLEEGHRKDWFNSPFIRGMGATALFSLTLCIWAELRRRKPFIDLRLLANRNFALGSLIGLGFGAVMYGSTYLLPLYLAQVQNYNALQIGKTIMWSGGPQVFMMPLAVMLLRRFDARLVLTLGLVLFGASNVMNAALTHQTGYDQLRWTQFVRALGMPLVIVPVTSLATGHIHAAQAGSASSLFNMLRNLGGSIGIALLATQLDWREKLHSARLQEWISPFRNETAERLAAMSSYFAGQGAEPVAAQAQALQAVGQIVRREATVRAYGDSFLLLGAVLLSLIALVWICRPVKGTSAAGH